MPGLTLALLRMLYGNHVAVVHGDALTVRVDVHGAMSLIETFFTRCCQRTTQYGLGGTDFNFLVLDGVEFRLGEREYLPGQSTLCPLCGEAARIRDPGWSAIPRHTHHFGRHRAYWISCAPRCKNCDLMHLVLRRSRLARSSLARKLEREPRAPPRRHLVGPYTACPRTQRPGRCSKHTYKDLVQSGDRTWISVQDQCLLRRLEFHYSMD